MDPRLIYTDFLMNDSEVLLQPTTDAEPTFKDDRDYTYCALAVFRSDDPDLARDPLSSNRRLQESADLEMFGTMIVAGPTPDQVFFSSTLPPEGLHLTLCDKSLCPTLGLRRQDFYSFYDCLRQFGLEWFGRRSFFDKRDVTGQGLWMDLALARKSGQALHDNYLITNSQILAPLWKFFRAAVRNLTSVYENRAYAQTEEDTQP